jgi:hypothetical protein
MGMPKAGEGVAGEVEELVVCMNIPSRKRFLQLTGIWSSGAKNDEFAPGVEKLQTLYMVFLMSSSTTHSVWRPL